MKGLLRNNYYTVKDSLKTVGIMTIGVYIITLIILFLFPEKIIVIDYVTIGIMGGFSGLSFTLLYNGNLSKWNRFELTMPIVRQDVIRMRYLTFALFGLIGIMSISAILYSSYVLLGTIDIERSGYFLTFGIVISMLLPAFMHPLILVLGMDKGQIVYLFSIILSIVFFVLPSIVFENALDKIENPNLVYRMIMSVISISIFIGSYFLSRKIYDRMDL